MDNLFQDIRYAVRQLRNSPGFLAVAAVTIALGVAATTTIFSITNEVLFKTPPGIRDPGTLVTLHRIGEDGSSFHAFSHRNYLDYREGDNGLEELAVFSTLAMSLSREESDPAITLGQAVSPNYFAMLGVQPALGRLFLPEDGQQGAEPVAVLGHATWLGRFSGDSTVIGRSISVNRRGFTVIGVTEEGFQGHQAIVDVGVYIPVTAVAGIKDVDLGKRDATWLEALGRRAPGVEVVQVEAAMNRLAAVLEAEFGDANPDEGVDVRNYTSLVAAAVGPVSAFAALMLGASAIILLIACVNVSGVTLARATRRGKEVALRMAVGARRGRVVRQLLTESTVLFLIGGAGGVTLTYYATHLLNSFQPPIPLPLAFDFSPDLRVLSYSLAVVLLTGLVFGLAPALHATSGDLNTTLKEGVGSGKGSRLRNGLVVAQVAGSALLLIGAGLFARSLTRADAMDVGYDLEQIHVLTVDLGIHNYEQDEATVFFNRLRERVEAMSAVEALAMIDVLPLTLSNQESVFFIRGREQLEGLGLFRTDLATVTPSYFETVKLPLLKGRGFGEADREGSPLVAIINETTARRAWPGEDPVGKRIQFGSLREPNEMEIIGVAADARYRYLGDRGRMMIYVPSAQWPRLEMSLLARVRDGAEPEATLRDAVHSLDPGLPIVNNAPYEKIVGISLLPNRVAAGVASAFGALALLLASVGLYGVVALSVSQRTREMGIRLALGAEPGRVRRLVMKEGVRVAGVGVVVGVALAASVTHAVKGLLYGISPLDPLTYGATALVLLGSASLASLVPASRATRTDPIAALREE